MADASRPQDGSNGQATSSTPSLSCHYEALGITAKDQASEDDIKKAYRAKSREWHPDKNPDNPQATAMFQRINEAYNALKDPEKRRKYNAVLWIEKVYGFLGPRVQPDPTAVTWVQNALQVGGNAVDSIVALRNTVMTHISPKMQYVRMQCAVDVNVFHPPGTDRSVILIAGQPNNVRQAKATVDQTIREAQGTVAPNDGVVVIAPSNMLPHQLQHIYQSAQYSLNLLGGAHVLLHDDRFIVRMCARLVQVVAQFQQWMNFSASILLPDGQRLNCWQYAHVCETQTIPAHGMLPPDDPIDSTWVK
ncbi:dnaJ, partial [Symbiodinium sp. KB8]